MVYPNDFVFCQFGVNDDHCCQVVCFTSPHVKLSYYLIAKNMHCSYSYCRQNCAVSSVTEPVLSSSLQMSVNETCLAIVNQPNLEVNSHTNEPAMPGLFG